MPYALDGERARPIVIEAQGVRHQIQVRADQIARRTVVDYQPEKLTVKNGGTAVAVERGQACLEVVRVDPRFLPQLVFDFSLFNPHAAFRLLTGNSETAFPAHDSAWTKWSPRDPTSAHWYSLARFEELVASYVAAGCNLFVREFVATFRGLTGTQTRMQVVEAAGFERGTKLEDLVDSERRMIKHDALGRLLGAMRKISQPPPPEKLGVLGKEHFRASLPEDAADDQSFRYDKQVGTDRSGLPFVVEAASRITINERLQGLHVGLNWSVPLTNPLQQSLLPFEGIRVHGLEGLLRQKHIDFGQDEFALALHIATPRFDFLDRGKGSADLDPVLAEAVAKVVSRVIKEWASIKKSIDRDNHRAARRAEEELRRGRAKEKTVKEAAWEVMEEAYLKASGGGKLPAKARQVMYAARGYILKVTGRASFDDDYFTQELLPQYQRDYPEETKDWDVVYDERGHLIEPHTGYEIGIGTLPARGYLDAAKGNSGLGALELPELVFRFPTRGPKHRYGSILFIEKEGFMPLLEAVHLADRYDLAIMSTKGMGSTAGRMLIERLAPGGVRIFVVHDFDKSGFSIASILSRDTKRYQFANPPEIINFGLRLADVRRYRLESEPVFYKKGDPTANLKLNGATEEEIRFLVEGQRGGDYYGRRVELNAFASDQFVEWLEAKLKAHKAAKVIPDARILEQSWRRACELHELEQVLKQAVPEVRRKVRARELPANLAKRIAGVFKEEPSLAWDEALDRLAKEED
jgi:hypothetical protein